jgi:2-iminobutanoate/2-iminopropanoate deaminase
MGNMGLQKINCDKWVAKFSTFSHAVVANDFIYVSGVLGTKQDKLEIVDGGILTETESIIYHMSNILETCGAQFEDIVKINVYLINIEMFEQINSTYQRLVSWEPPAITVTGVRELALGASVTMDCIAYKPHLSSIAC